MNQFLKVKSNPAIYKKGGKHWKIIVQYSSTLFVEKFLNDCLMNND